MADHHINMYRSIFGDIASDFDSPRIRWDSHLMLPTERLTDFADIISCSLYSKDYAQNSWFLLRERFIFVVICGVSVSVVGIVANAILLRILSAKVFRRTNFIYLMVLAILDITILINYILLIGIGISKDYFHSLRLFRFWYFYFRPLFTLGRIVQTAQTCLILAATVEKYIAVCRRKVLESLTPTTRGLIVAGVVAFALASKVSSYWELDVIYTNCSGFASIVEDRGILTMNAAYCYYKLWVDPVIQTYIPFVTLLLLNIWIVLKVRENWKRYVALIVNNMLGQYLSPEPMVVDAEQEYRAAQRDLRDATFTTAGIVTCYLISNSLNVVLTFLEQTRPSFLDQQRKFYILAADASSFLVVLTSTIRLPLYHFCNSKIRKRINHMYRTVQRSTLKTRRSNLRILPKFRLRDFPTEELVEPGNSNGDLNRSDLETADETKPCIDGEGTGNIRSKTLSQLTSLDEIALPLRFHSTADSKYDSITSYD